MTAPPLPATSVERALAALDLGATTGADGGMKRSANVYVVLRDLLADHARLSAALGEAREALAEHDAKVGECRIDGVRPQLDVSKDCDRCGAGVGDSCRLKNGAAFTLIKTIRTALQSLNTGI